MKNNNFKLTKNQIKLLNNLISDQKNAPKLYKPGKYWWRKSIAAIKEIYKNGLNEFRSSTDVNTAAASFGDSRIIDMRRIVETSSITNKIGLAILNHTPLKRLFDAQVNTTRGFANKLFELEKKGIEFSNLGLLTKLTSNYKIENSINWGCDMVTEFNNKKYSTHYLNMLNHLEFVEKNTSIKNSNSFLEIGPGFGALIHLLEQNYQNLRKFIAIDIVPNVWVVSEYLRSHYGDCVKDYSYTKELKEIKFKEDSSLEIFVIPPWEIEKISSSIDCFWNSSSFVEMPKEIVENYSEKIKKINTEKSIYSFISYENFNLQTTFNPNFIPNLFPYVQFEMFRYPSLLDKQNEDYYYLGKSKD